MSYSQEKTDTLQAVETILAYHFTDDALLWTALQAAGSFYVGERTDPDGNKRLAILGDAVLKLALVEDWYHTGHVKLRADIIVKEVATNGNLDRVGKAMGLDRHINRRGTGASGEVSWKTMCDTMKAVLGAVWFDGGLKAVKEVMGILGLVPRMAAVRTHVLL